MNALYNAVDHLLSKDTSELAARIRQEVLAERHPRTDADHDPIPEHYPAVQSGFEPDTPEARKAAAQAKLAAAQAEVDVANAEVPAAREPEPAGY